MRAPVPPAPAPFLAGLEHELGLWVGPRPPAPDEPYTATVLRACGVGTACADQFLANGGRLYVDAGNHLEYATPECRTVRETVAADEAGMRIVAEGSRRVERLLSQRVGRSVHVRVLRANVAPNGSSWGSHENYLVPSWLGWVRIGDGIASHLASRIVFTGTGAVVPGNRRDRPRYRVSPRAALTGEISATSAMSYVSSKPMLLIREEPLADPLRYRRLQVICGDANMAQVASALRIGTTAIALQLLQRREAPDVRLDDPVRAMRWLAGDLRLARTVATDRGRYRASDLQHLWLEAAKRSHERDPFPSDLGDVLTMWEQVLHDLDVDPWQTADRVDWVAKLALLRALVDRESLAWDDPRLVMADLAYHDVRPERSLHHRMVRAGRMQMLVDDAQVEHARHEPPSRSRAVIRADLIRRARRASIPYDVDWHTFRTRGSSATTTVMLDDPFDDRPLPSSTLRRMGLRDAG